MPYEGQTRLLVKVNKDGSEERPELQRFNGHTAMWEAIDTVFTANEQDGDYSPEFEAKKWVMEYFGE